MHSNPPDIILQNCGKILGSDIQSSASVSGGDISQAWKLQAEGSTYFLKYNDSSWAEKMFETEAKGLQLLASTNTIKIPSVIGQESNFLLLEFINDGFRSIEFWESFGVALANLHRNTNSKFGLDHSNYIGSLTQQNGNHDNFIDFYMNERLQPKLQLAIDSNRLTKTDDKAFQVLYKKLPEICPDEPPALIHGDLWSGNFLADEEGKPVLIDPSVAYSHRELDLAMSRLFGGFDRTFYRAYEEAYPLAPGFEKRLPIYQLYYLLVHVNLFGGGYVGSVRRILKEY